MRWLCDWVAGSGIQSPTVQAMKKAWWLRGVELGLPGGQGMKLGKDTGTQLVCAVNLCKVLVFSKV